MHNDIHTQQQRVCVLLNFEYLNMLLWNRSIKRMDAEVGLGVGWKEGRKEMFNLMTHSTHFIYGYIAWDIW